MTDNPVPLDEEEKSWNDLPAELKLQCMRGLSFKDIFGLRSGCKFDRGLVDATMKFFFARVDLKPDALVLKLDNGEEHRIDFESNDRSKVAPLLAYILTQYKIEVFQYRERDQEFNDEFKRLMDSERSINVKHLEFHHSQELFQINPFFLLEKLRGNLETCVLDLGRDVININDLFMIPAVIGAGTWTFENVDIRQVGYLITNWRDHDMKIGTNLKTIVEDADLDIRRVFEKFQFNKIFWQESEMLITTRQADRQIYITHQDNYLYAFVIAPGTNTRKLTREVPNPIFNVINRQAQEARDAAERDASPPPGDDQVNRMELRMAARRAEAQRLRRARLEFDNVLMNGRGGARQLEPVRIEAMEMDDGWAAAREPVQMLNWREVRMRAHAQRERLLDDVIIHDVIPPPRRDREVAQLERSQERGRRAPAPPGRKGVKKRKQ